MSERRSFDAPSRALARLAVHHPRVAFNLAAKLGALRNRLTRRWPTADEVRRLFPDVDAVNIAMQIGALNERNRVLVHTISRSGLHPIRPLVHFEERVTPPCILALFHVGALQATGAALERLDAPVLAFRHKTLVTTRPPLEVISTEGDDQQRAAAFHRALVHLRGGGCVAMALDVVPGAAIDTRCLGRNLPLAPGAFALARLTGAPILPLTARWTNDGIAVATHDPVTSADAAAAWLERYLLASPAQITLGLMRNLLYDFRDIN